VNVTKRLFLAAVCLLPAASSLIANAANERPALMVLISVDQFRRDYLERFEPFFVEDGFARLLNNGADYTNCHFRHSYTITAPGHATLSTGVHADVHGIIANDWRDGPSLIQHGSVDDAQYPLVGMSPVQPGRAPSRLLAPAAADQLKAAYKEKSKVIGIALKDRASILMSGHQADGAYWMHAGSFVSSSYYFPKLPTWASNFNAANKALAWQGKQWDHLLEPALYERTQGPDAAPGEEDVDGLGITLPKTLGRPGPTPDPRFLDLFSMTPFASELMEEFAEQAVIEESLGHHEAPDLLCLGFSQIDITGHAYGPDSHEIMDSVIRLDRTLSRLFRFLDTRVGAGRWTVVLTADHGCTPIPEGQRAKGIEASRLDRPGMDKAVNAALKARFGPAPAGFAYVIRDAQGYRVLEATLRAAKLDREVVQTVVRDAVAAWSQVAAAYTRTELLRIPVEPEGDSLIERVRRSFNEQRSADVIYVMKPNVTDKSVSGCSHGSPYDCDDHVPQLWYGAGVKAGKHGERIGQETLAPTLCTLLGVQPPPLSKGKPNQVGN